MSTGLIYDERFLRHDTGGGHPERSQRLAAILERLRKEPYWSSLTRLPFGPADLSAIQAVHDLDYINRLRAACKARHATIDCMDSAICPESYDIALLAVGGILAAVDAVIAGPEVGVANAFCALRPPGHHAERDCSMGFCLFNNVALAAQHLVSRHGLQRIAIVDFDVHHGNGTQHIFEDRSDVLFISLHEHPDHLYPGTGYPHERGRGPGKGFTINLALPPRSSDAAYRDAFETTVLPALDRYQPQFLLVSAGFDASEYDPLADMQVTASMFVWMTRQLMVAAERHCRGRLVSALEGGYDLGSLAECVAGHVGVLAGQTKADG